MDECVRYVHLQLEDIHFSAYGPLQDVCLTLKQHSADVYLDIYLVNTNVFFWDV